MIELDPRLVRKFKKRIRKIKRETDSLYSQEGAPNELEHEHLHMLMEEFSDEIVTRFKETGNDLSSEELIEARSEFSQLVHRLLDVVFEEDAKPKKWRWFRKKI